MTNKREREKFSLITIYGDEILIIPGTENYRELWAEMSDDLDANNIYFVGGFGESATFKGHELTVIDFKKVIGRD